MASNNESAGVATYREFDPEAAEKALKEAAKAEPKAPARAAAEKKEN
jgi:hypothetical protein